MKAPQDCAGCVHLARGSENDACIHMARGKGEMFSQAVICKTIGHHETAQQMRVRIAVEQGERRAKLIESIGFESPRQGEMRALGFKHGGAQ